MIETNEYVGYNEDEHFYYLTPAGMIEYTGYDFLDNLWPNIALDGIKMGRLLHTLYTKSRYNAKAEKTRHLDFIEWRIAMNERGERQAVINALVLMVEMKYDNTNFERELMSGTIEWPKSIIRELHNNQVLVYGEITGQVPEDEYRVGY